jgi:hypothetical protein
VPALVVVTSALASSRLLEPRSKTADTPMPWVVFDSPKLNAASVS